MADTKEKVYVGKGRYVGKFNQLKMSLSIEKLKEYANEKGYVNILIGEMRKPDDYGNTHNAMINDWTPPQNNSIPPPADKPATGDDLPF